MWQQAGQNEQNMAGGQMPVGQETLYTREKIEREDKLTYAGGTYEVIAEPQPARLMGLDFCWKTVIKRG
jgi:hypothetical protein